MSRTITINPFDPASVRAAANEIREYAKWVEARTTELVERLADYGLTRVRMGYDAALFDEDKEVRDVDVSVENRGENTYAIVASGHDVLFLEFGSGIKYGDGHPLNADFGMGPGTYPGQTHVPDPGYWYYTGADGESHSSEGNAPSMVMYLTGMELEAELLRIAREVFNS